MAIETAGSVRQPLRYSNVAVTLHWLIVVLLLIQVWLGLTFADMEKGPARAEFFTWHKTVGATILVLTLVRLAYRLTNPPPPYPREMPRWRRNAAIWSHRLLYFLLIALPLTGLIAVSGNGQATTALVGGIPLPTVPGISRNAGEISGDVHVTLVWTTIALLVLHISAALHEQFRARAGVAYRMPPFQPRGEESAAIGQG
jgi:cytochrome b561